MITLRITKLAQCLPYGLGVLAAFGLFGCGTSTPPETENTPNAVSTPITGTSDPSWLTSREKMPAADTDRIEYDAEKRTLTFYDLPSRDSWMVQLPDEEFGRHVTSKHRLPEGVNISRTMIYYNRAGIKMSMAVSVAQIEAGHLSHSSLAIGP